MPNQYSAERYRRFSTHWLRHTSATMQVEAGIDIKVVQRNLRHNSIETTMKYVHFSKTKQFDDTEKFSI